MGLTFPQCDLDFYNFAVAFFCHGYLGEAIKGVIGQEVHKDGGTHYHCYVHWNFKLRSRDPRMFDLEGHHPNIKVFSGKGNKQQQDRWISYCKKEGLWYQFGFLQNLFTFIHWQNYRAQKQDLLAWEQDAMAQQLKPALPFRLPLEFKDGRKGRTWVRENMLQVKRRNLLIWGPPNRGKSTWAQTEFEGKRAYMRYTETYSTCS